VFDGIVRQNRSPWTDLLGLLALTLLLIATGIGLRDPWPPDEPRFALAARDMVATGDWLLPRIGGEPYADKPPLFFWLLASGLEATNSLRVAFLLPSLLAAFGCVVLVYDLGRRLWNREAGLAGALALLFTVQFVWQARQAQIDATLCFFTTLSLYGLLRHCLQGPHWAWYATGWAAAGFGIITKGVGFLPLLVLLPYALSRVGRWQPRPAMGASWRWLLGPLALVVAVSLWLVPMLMAAGGNPELRAYRDEILLGQTVTRYVSAWHHREPIWYFILEVIPGLWLPLTALLPWLLPRWRENLRQRDLRVLLPLAWVVLVIVFFSLSTGKRGVYVLPALPALALASGALLGQIAQRRGAQRLVFALACSAAVIGVAGGAYLLVEPAQRQNLIDLYDIDGIGPLWILGAVSALTCLICRPHRGFLAWGLVMCELLLLTSFFINPAINDARSGAAFMNKVEAMMPGEKALGLVGYKEQYLLELRRPVASFGHRRRDADQEAADASLWLSQDRDRVLLVNEEVLHRCFPGASASEVDYASRHHWFLVEGPASADCVSRGRESAAISYDPSQALDYSHK
jgi:4-amino-4-deoxy-L-arabinose transferase-like glycosyltransferase